MVGEMIRSSAAPVVTTIQARRRSRHREDPEQPGLPRRQLLADAQEARARADGRRLPPRGRGAAGRRGRRHFASGG